MGAWLGRKLCGTNSYLHLRGGGTGLLSVLFPPIAANTCTVLTATFKHLQTLLAEHPLITTIMEKVRD